MKNVSFADDSSAILVVFKDDWNRSELIQQVQRRHLKTECNFERAIDELKQEVKEAAAVDLQMKKSMKKAMIKSGLVLITCGVSVAASEVVDVIVDWADENPLTDLIQIASEGKLSQGQQELLVETSEELLDQLSEAAQEKILQSVESAVSTKTIGDSSRSSRNSKRDYLEILLEDYQAAGQELRDNLIPKMTLAELLILNESFDIERNRMRNYKAALKGLLNEFSMLMKSEVMQGSNKKTKGWRLMVGYIDICRYGSFEPKQHAVAVYYKYDPNEVWFRRQYSRALYDLSYRANGGGAGGCVAGSLAMQGARRPCIHAVQLILRHKELIEIVRGSERRIEEVVLPLFACTFLKSCNWIPTGARTRKSL